MTFSSILNRYVFAEMIPPFLVNILFFSFIFLLTRILDITNLIVNYQIGLMDVAWLVIYSLPYFLVFVIPMSVMMTVLLTVLRLSNDNEILAMKAGGISLRGLLPPVLTFCLLGTLLTAFMISYGLPWGRLSFRDLTLKVAGANLDIGLKERTFNDSFNGVMLYVNEIDLKSKTLIDVFIQDRRDPKAAITVLAPRGKLYSSPDPSRPSFHMQLFNGTIHQVSLAERSANAARFETYELRLDLQQVVRSARNHEKNQKEMYPRELVRYLAEHQGPKDPRYYNVLIEYHKKFSIPFACFPMGVLAIPLGVRSRTARRSFGLTLGIGAFLFYYLMLSAGLVFGETGAYPPLIGMWVPNLVMLVLGIWLFVRSAHDRPVTLAFPVLFRKRFGPFK